MLPCKHFGSSNKEQVSSYKGAHRVPRESKDQGTVDKTESSRLPRLHIESPEEHLAVFLDIGFN